jgi:hypothetical protein
MKITIWDKPYGKEYIPHELFNENLWKTKRDAEIHCTLLTIEKLGNEVYAFLEDVTPAE